MRETIFKSRQRDEVNFWRWLAGLLFGSRCKSYLREYGGSRRECKLKAGHDVKHTDGSGLHWGYGDNWLEGN